ncbi:MAG: tetratricopeptide repeat protein [Chitinophagaceae bacterium]
MNFLGFQNFNLAEVLMNRFLLLINCCVFLANTPSFAGQNNADSSTLVQLLTHAEDIADEQPDSSLFLFKKVKETTKKSRLEVLYARALYGESYNFFSTLQYDSVIDRCNEAASIFKKNKLSAEEIKSYSRIGLAWMYLNKYQRALQAMFKGVDLAESIGDKGLEAKMNNNIGLVYESLEDWESALNYAHKSLRYKDSIDDKRGIASSYNNIGNLYYYQSKNKESLPFFHNSISLYSEMKDSARIVSGLANIGNVFEDLGNVDSAIYYLNLAFAYQSARKNQMPTEWCITVAGLAAAWQQKGDIKKSAQYLKACDACIEEIPDFNYLKGVYSVKATYYKQTGDYKQASKYLELSMAAQDSIYQKSRNLENQKIAIRYEFGKKAEEDSLEYQLRISQQEIVAGAYKNKMYLVVVVGVLLLAFAGIIIQRLRILQRIKRKRELEKMRHEIAGDLHDDIGSTLSSIQIISSLMVKQCGNDANLKLSAGNISRLSDKVANGIKEIVWSVNPANDTLEAIVEQMRKLSSEILDPECIQFLLKKELAEPQKMLLPIVRKNLIMLLKEALNNARKYSRAAQIDIFIWQNKAALQLRIKDYGEGFEMATIKRGNGLNNMERRAKEMNATLSILSKIGEGTEISLKIPLP